MSIRILLVDDHTLFRSGLRLLLQRQPDFEIVAEAGDGVEGLKRAKELKPDVVLLDLNLPGLSGLETLQLLVQDLPSCAVIILTVSEEADELGQALRDARAAIWSRTSTPRRSPARSGARRAASRSSRKA